MPKKKKKVAKKAGGKGTVITVDFTGVESGMGVRVPEGDYALKIAKAVLKRGKESQEKYIEFQMEITKEKYKGKKLRYTCSLQKQSLWNLRNLIEACGHTAPSKAVKLPLAKMVGWECGGSVVDTQYENRIRSEIAALFPSSQLEEEGTTDKEETFEEANGEEEETTEEEPEELF